METIEYSLSDNNLHIVDSYRIPKRDFREILTDIEWHNPQCTLFANRSMCSMILEWSTHNLLYALHIARNRTKDVDINYPQKWYVRCAYALIGPICWLLIR